MVAHHNMSSRAEHVIIGGDGVVLEGCTQPPQNVVVDILLAQSNEVQVFM